MSRAPWGTLKDMELIHFTCTADLAKGSRKVLLKAGSTGPQYR